MTDKQKAALAKGAANKKDFTSETAKAAQKKGAEQRHKNRLAREILEEELAKEDRKRRGMAALARDYASGDLATIKLAQEILEEKQQQDAGVTIVLDFGDLAKIANGR